MITNDSGAKRIGPGTSPVSKVPGYAEPAQSVCSHSYESRKLLPARFFKWDNSPRWAWRRSRFLFGQERALGDSFGDIALVNFIALFIVEDFSPHHDRARHHGIDHHLRVEFIPGTTDQKWREFALDRALQV